MVSYIMNRNQAKEFYPVLILIVVDNGLVQPSLKGKDYRIACLNPYCSGQ